MDHTNPDWPEVVLEYPVVFTVLLNLLHVNIIYFNDYKVTKFTIIN